MCDWIWLSFQLHICNSECGKLCFMNLTGVKLVLGLLFLLTDLLDGSVQVDPMELGCLLSYFSLYFSKIHLGIEDICGENGTEEKKKNDYRPGCVSEKL